MVEADRTLIASKGARFLRIQCAALLVLARARVQANRAELPSYVLSAVDALFAAFDRWTEDERAIDTPAQESRIA